MEKDVQVTYYKAKRGETVVQVSTKSKSSACESQARVPPVPCYKIVHARVENQDHRGREKEWAPAGRFRLSGGGARERCASGRVVDAAARVYLASSSLATARGTRGGAFCTAEVRVKLWGHYGVNRGLQDTTRAAARG